MTNRRLAFDPKARTAFTAGFNKLANALEVTLGPRGRVVAVERDNRRRAPELLDDGATLARRFLGLPDRFETMGAFLARHIAWQAEEAIGDGSTTAVVIARHLINTANRYIAAGFNSMRLRRGIEKAMPLVLAQLESLAVPLEGSERIVSLGASITANQKIGELLEEIFDVVGPYGAIDVRTSYARTHSCRYINGTFWNQGWISSHFTTDAGTALLKDPYILLTDQILTRAEELAQTMQAIRDEGNRGLVVIATGVESEALNMLVANKVRDIMPTLAIKAPGLGPEKTEILQDLAVLTGARVFIAQGGESVKHATLADLGGAREVQAIRSGFTLIGGMGRPAAIRERSHELRSRLPGATYGRERDRLTERAGKLLGGVALLEVGGATDTERDYAKDRSKDAVNVIRHALQSGVVPGGGVAYLRCLSALENLAYSPDEMAGVEILRATLHAPLRAILGNAGIEPGPIIDQICHTNGHCAYDVLRHQYVPVDDANIVDPMKVAYTALQTGVSGGLMAMTTDVLVHKPRRNRDEEVDFLP